MSMRDSQREELLRLERKTLEGRFRTILQEGLNCSPFEAEAVTDALREVYFPWIEEASTVGPPGRVVLVAVAADEPAGKAVADCGKQTVLLLVHRGAEDDRLLQLQGPTAFRRARLPDLCQPALSQSALLTREDLAYRLFFASRRTISRDLAWLRSQNPPPPLPLRSLVHDIGAVLTYGVQIIRLALEGKTTTEICRFLRHSPAGVANYLSTFTRCAQLAVRQFQASQIAFLLRRGRALITQYLDLLAESQRDLTILHLCAEMILEFLHQHLRPRENVGHGQVLWLAIRADHPPLRGQPLTYTHLVRVVFDLSTPDGLQARLDPQPPAQRLRTQAVRLCEQAHRQNALLSNCDLATLLHTDDSQIATQLDEHKRQTGRLVPRRATLHDVGTCLTHKRLTCWKRYAEGNDPPVVACETLTLWRPLTATSPSLIASASARASRCLPTRSPIP
jgi:Protein of unknown function (DUF1670)